MEGINIVSVMKCLSSLEKRLGELVFFEYWVFTTVFIFIGVFQLDREGGQESGWDGVSQRRE